MKIRTREIIIPTKGNPDLIDITERINDILRDSKLSEGNITIFVVGSTAALTTFEFEPGLIKDIREFYERLIPKNVRYHHDDTWGDANGFSHLRAAVQGPNLTIPFNNKRLLLGTWQQVVLAEFDNRPRERTVVVQLVGE